MNFKELRKRHGITQAKLANITNIPLDTIRSWEQGRRTPPGYVSDYIREKLEVYEEQTKEKEEEKAKL